MDFPVGSSEDALRIVVLETTKPWYAEADSECGWIEVAFTSAETGEANPHRFVEYAYEEPDLVVLEAANGWFRVEEGTGSSWIEVLDSERVHSY